MKRVVKDALLPSIFLVLRVQNPDALVLAENQNSHTESNQTSFNPATMDIKGLFKFIEENR